MIPWRVFPPAAQGDAAGPGPWFPLALPPQRGKTFVVTGGSSGLGYFIVEQLAATGARVLMASRSQERMDAAMASVRRIVPGAELGSIVLDLGSLASVRTAAARLLDLGGIDGLVENAGITDMPRRREVTSDGFELLVGTNHLGHFALTALVLPALRPGGRIVTLGSIATRLVAAREDDLLSERPGSYRGFGAYATSKHATTVFALELDRRLRAAGRPVSALVAHPGYAISVQAARRPGINDLGLAGWMSETLQRPFSQGRDRGAWPIVRALLDPAATGGEFYGPRHTLFGAPVRIGPVPQDSSARFGAELWSRSEVWTGIPFPIPSA